MRIQVTLAAIALASGATMFASGAHACEDKDKTSASAEYDHTRASALQRALQDAGYYDGEIDGVLDRDVRQALIRFQNDRGFVPSGRIDPRTRRALQIDGVESDEIRRVRGEDEPADDVGSDVEFERPWDRTPFELDDPATLTPETDPAQPRIPVPEPEQPDIDLQSGEEEQVTEPSREDDTTPVTGGATETEPTEAETEADRATGGD